MKKIIKNDVAKYQFGNKKEENKKNRIVKALKIVGISIISIIILLLFIIVLMYNIFNYKLYKKMVESNEEKNIEIEYDYYIFKLSKKNKEYIIQNKIELSIRYKNYAITLDYNNIPEYLMFDISTEVVESNLEGFSGLKVLNVDFSKFKNMDSVIEFTVDVDNLIFTNKNIDVYKINNITSEINILKKSVDITKGNVSFEIYNKDLSNDENNNNFFIVYVPLKDIVINKDNVEIKRTMQEKIEYNIIPENATNKELSLEYNNEGLEVTSDLNITAKSHGTYNLKISVKEESITKEINVNVLEIAQKIELDKDSVSIEIGNQANIKATVQPENAVNKELIWTSSNESTAKVNENGVISTVGVGKCEIEIKTKEEPVISSKIAVQVNKKTVVYNQSSSANYGSSSSSGLTYIQGILIANKKYSLPADYNPGVNATALAAFNSMKAAAANEGVSLWILSGFRSYNTQAGLYNRYVSQYGQASADTFSARPGHSEHQTGLAFDVNSVEDSFAYTKEGIWLANNCHKFGFIVRYPQGKQAITGYKYEPWHIRYLGVDIATKVYQSGLCLEEYLGI